MNQDQVRVQVGGMCRGWTDLCERIAATQDESQRLSTSIEEAKNAIGSLIAEKRAAPRRDKSYYRDLIQSAKDGKSELISEARAKRAELSELKSQRQAVRREERSCRRLLGTELQRMISGEAQLGVITPTWASQDVSDLRQSVASGRRFCEEQLHFLDEAFGGKSEAESEDLTYIPEPPVSSVLGAVAGPGPQLHLVEPPRLEPYLTLSGSRTVPCESYNIFDTISLDGLNTDQKAVVHVEALLHAHGHPVVLPVGTSGLPDMISLDSAGRLWISEIKGTEVSRPLPSTGVKRVLAKDGDAKTGKKEMMYENSAEWLLRTGRSFNRVDQVISAIAAAMEKEPDPANKELLRRLGESYREAAIQGFGPLCCDKQLVQVGFQSDSDSLKPPQYLRSKVLDEYIDAVEPKKIVQIEVALGSQKSPISDQEGNAAEPPPSSGSKGDLSPSPDTSGVTPSAEQ